MRDRLLSELASLIYGDIRDKPSAEGIADILWMAQFLRPSAFPLEPDGAPGDDSLALGPGNGIWQETTKDRASLHPFRAGTESTELRPATEVRVPAVSALPNATEISRALRPLKRSAFRAGELRLAEEETAAFFGETGLIWPALRTARERWLRLDLVVDTSASMAVWQQTAHELLRLLQHHGTFRDVRAWAIDSGNPDTRLTPLTRRASRPLLSHTAGELAAPGGQRMVLVLTDAVSEGWHQGSIMPYLLTWARTSPTAIVQVLPRRLWRRTMMPVTQVTARMRLTAQPPLRLTGPIRAGREHYGQLGQDKDSVTWVPVMPLSGDWINAWATIAAGTSDEPAQVLATPVFPGRRPLHPPSGDGGTAVPDLERLRIFQQDTGSLEAVELAGYLAAAPLTLPIMRLVQHAMMPHSGPEHLAEVFLSGLLVRTDEAAGGTSDLDEVRYEFRQGIREQLLGGITRRESLRVLEVLAGVSEALSRPFGSTLDFRALVPTGNAVENLLSPESAPFAKIAVSVLDGIGGRYSELARTLGQADIEAGGDTPTIKPQLGQLHESRGHNDLANDSSVAKVITETDSIAAEIKALRRGRGMRGDLTGRIGPHLVEVAGGDRDQAARRLANEIIRLSGQLPEELRTAVLIGLGLDPAVFDMPTYEQRTSFLASMMNRSRQTAVRRIDDALYQLATEINAELTRSTVEEDGDSRQASFPEPGGLPSQAEIAAEIQALRKNRAFSGDVSGKLGPVLLELVGGDARHANDQLGRDLRALAGRLTEEMRTAILAALALHNDTREMTTYSQRKMWLAVRLDRGDRTAERRIDEAQRLLAQEIAAELERRRGQSDATDDGWYTKHLSVLYLLDGDAPEAIEQRRIVSTRHDLTEITILLDTPRESGQRRLGMKADVTYGGNLVRTEELSRNRTRYTIVLPRPLDATETYEYEIRIQVEPDERIRDYYIFRPEHSCDAFDLRVRFDRRNLPAWVRQVAGEDEHVYWSFDSIPEAHERVSVDATGEATAKFTGLRLHRGFGLQWGWPTSPDP
jgi:hypothetical protein